jgi:hypothetical protein
MALSLALALIPVVMDDEPNGQKRRSTLVGAFFLLGSLCLYQPSLNAFLVIASLEDLILQNKNEPTTVITSLVKRRVVQLLIAICAYKIVALYTVREKYSIEHSALVGGADAVAIVLRNLITFWSFSIEMLKGRLRSTLVLPIVLALLSSIAVGLRYGRRTAKAGKFFWISGAFVTPIVMLFGTFGFLTFLQAPAGGARTFIGFGALLASSLILISALLTDCNVPGTLQCGLLFIPAYTMIAFAAIYANAAKVQKDYEKHIAEKLSDDLKEAMAAEPISNLIIVGSVGYAPIVNRMAAKRYRLLLHLIPIDLRGDATPHAVLRYFGIYLPEETSEAQRLSIVAEITTSVPLRSNSYYQIFLLDHVLVVRLISSTYSGSIWQGEALPGATPLR